MIPASGFVLKTVKLTGKILAVCKRQRFFELGTGFLIVYPGGGGGGELIDFYGGGDHVRPFPQTPKYVDQSFQRPQIC